MRQQLIHITLLSLLLFAACSESRDPNGEEDVNYITLQTRVGEDAGSDMPCFFFWRHHDLTAPDYEPYIYSTPTGSIDTYKSTKFNTKHTYPAMGETVYAMGISPRTIMPGTAIADVPDWTTIPIPLASKPGLVDIQCAPIISANEQNPFNDPLKFEHELAKLEFMVYCEDGMWESVSKHINVKDISITISSEDGQRVLFPKELTLSPLPNPTQYIVNGYDVGDTDLLSATISLANLPGNTKKANAEPVGNFYLVPGFQNITVELKATYKDTTTDGKEEITRVWEKLSINNIGDSGDSGLTIAGKRYKINIGFEKSRIILGAEVEDWPDDIDN